MGGEGENIWIMITKILQQFDTYSLDCFFRVYFGNTETLGLTFLKSEVFIWSSSHQDLTKWDLQDYKKYS